MLCTFYTFPLLFDGIHSNNFLCTTEVGNKFAATETWSWSFSELTVTAILQYLQFFRFDIPDKEGTGALEFLELTNRNTVPFVSSVRGA